MDWAQWLAIGMIGAASVIFLPMWLIGAISELLSPSKIKTSPSMSKAQGLLAIGCGNRTHTGQVP
jgi:hypothetical protein